MSSAVAPPPVRTPETVREAAETRYEYPGLPTTCDGAEAVVHVEIHVAQAAGASNGLSGMHERAGLLGGRLAVETRPGFGTRLTAELPTRFNEEGRPQ